MTLNPKPLIQRLQKVLARIQAGDLPTWWTTLKLAVYHTKGGGSSITKIVYGFVCAVGGIVVLMLTYTFCRVYLMADHKVDPIFAGLVGTALTVLVGIPWRAHQNQTKQQIQSLEAKDETPKLDQ